MNEQCKRFRVIATPVTLAVLLTTIAACTLGSGLRPDLTAPPHGHDSNTIRPCLDRYGSDCPPGRTTVFQRGWRNYLATVLRLLRVCWNQPNQRDDPRRREGRTVEEHGRMADVIPQLPGHDAGHQTQEPRRRAVPTESA